MPIQSAKDNNKKERVIDSSAKVHDESIQVTLRPKKLTEYVGQKHLKKHLQIAIDSARIRTTALEHILLYGPPGLGKTTLSMILANEMGAELKSTSGPAIEKQADLVSLLTNIQEFDVLFIDEIHRLRPQIEEILYSAMEDGCIDIMLGTGTGSTSIKMDIPAFTLIGATTKLSSLSNPLRDRFGNVLKLEFYETDELTQIVLRSAKLLDCTINTEVATAIAKRSRGTPRIANRLLKIIRDYQVVGQDVNDINVVHAIFTDLGIDEMGLDRLDQSLLKHLAESFSGNPVGLGTLASMIGEEEGTIEEVVEPYLLKIGFIERTARGRKITLLGEQHIRTSI